MNDDQLFDYLVAMGQMRPEEAELKKRQAMVDMLRLNSLKPQRGEMIGQTRDNPGVYVGPGIAGAVSQLGQAYFASKGQEGVDAQQRGLNSRQAQLLEELRKRRMQGGAYMPPSADSLLGDNIDAGGGWNPGVQ